jgi:hypothetical protein
MKLCPKCEKYKPLTEFDKSSIRKDGFSCYCKQCGKDYREAHKEKLLKYAEEYRKNNPEKIKELSYNYNRKPEVVERERIRCQKRRNNISLEDFRKTLYRTSARRAHRKHMAFSLPVDWFYDKIESGCCEVTGIKFDLTINTKENRGKMRPFVPSIDRKDCSKGYTPDNCRLTLLAFNTAIGAFGDEVYTKIAIAYLEKHGYKITENNNEN